MPQCSSCGGTAREGARFCPGCGAEISSASGTGGPKGSSLPPITTGPVPPVPARKRQVPGEGLSAGARTERRGPTRLMVAVLAASIALVVVVVARSGGDSGSQSSADANSEDGRFEPTGDENASTGGSSGGDEVTAATSAPRPTTTTVLADPPAQVLAQELATALATGDWNTARAIQPDRAGPPRQRLCHKLRRP